MEVPMGNSAPQISTVKIADFAQQKYANQCTVFGDSLYAHALLVARQAEIIAQRLYQDLRKDYSSAATKENISNIVHSALLHDVLNVSACAFEHVAEIASVQIAAMVADISRDYRLVETKRDLEFRGRLSQSPIGSQIVVAADIICTSKDLLKFLAANGASAAPKAKKILTQLDGDLLALHATSRYYVFRMYAHAAKNLLGDVSQAIKACRQRAKMDKLVAHYTQGVRSKAAAKKKTVSAEDAAHGVRRQITKKKGRAHDKDTHDHDS
jgi:hypothetical protein